MFTVHILTEAFRSSNGRAFLFPLLKYRHQLQQHYGISLRFFKQREAGLNQCDALLVDSKFYKPYWASSQRDEAIAHFADDYSQAGHSIFVDLNDSTGWVVPYVLPYVQTYLKSQLLKDRTLYSKPLYEHRPHSDYYHTTKNIINSEERWSLPITDPAFLAKMKVGWNSGYAHYGFLGPWLMKAYQETGASVFLRRPHIYFSPHLKKDRDFSYRFGLAYPEETLRYQRLQLKSILENSYRLPTNKLSRLQYFIELIRSKIVLSPFGYGEITLKDFETFICGSALMKPDMSCIETWPHFFEAGKTYIPFSWDLDDVVEKIEFYRAHDNARIAIAQEGQARYRDYISGPQSAELFCDYFVGLMKPKQF